MKWNEIVAGTLATLAGMSLWPFLCLIDVGEPTHNFPTLFLEKGFSEALFPTFFFLWVSASFVMMGLIIFFGDGRAEKIGNEEKQFARDKILIIACACFPMYYLFVYMLGMYRLGIGT